MILEHVKAVVFDWAGTMVDHGSRAPMGVFVETFKRFGITISVDEARGPMGLPKRDHIEAVLKLPRIEAAWQAAHGRTPSQSDVDALYEIFIPLNIKVVTDYATLIDGAAATVATLREWGAKIGSTTGYTREIMQPLLPLAEAQGYKPDNMVCAGDLVDGRPSPLMMYQTFVDLGVSPAYSVVKVDDTVPGIAEGRAAGTWTVGLSLSGNEVGLSQKEVDALSAEERTRVQQPAIQKLQAAGADYTIESVATLPDCIREIEKRLAGGERPPAP